MRDTVRLFVGMKTRDTFVARLELRSSPERIASVRRILILLADAIRRSG